MCHQGDETSPASETGGEVKGWPALKPGTFRSIAQQVWKSAGRLLKGSLDMLQKAGLMDVGATIDDFRVFAMKMGVPPSIFQKGLQSDGHHIFGEGYSQIEFVPRFGLQQVEPSFHLR